MNIDRYRPIIAVLMIAILTLTNLAYLLAYSNRTVTNYSAKWDMPQVKILNAILLIILIALAATKPKSEEEA
ncbi:MAG: hypothetical protein WCK51_12245 [Armatimonadota bacterium]